MLPKQLSQWWPLPQEIGVGSTDGAIRLQETVQQWDSKSGPDRWPLQPALSQWSSKLYRARAFKVSWLWLLVRKIFYITSQRAHTGTHTTETRALWNHCHPCYYITCPVFEWWSLLMHHSGGSSHIFIHVSLTTATKVHGSFLLISQFLKYCFNNSFFLHHSHSAHRSYGSSPYQWILFSSLKT